MEREEGFYWIIYAGEPEVALWEGGQWWATGSDVSMSEMNLRVLSERLLPPVS